MHIFESITMNKSEGCSKGKESIYCISTTRINSIIIRFNHVPEIQMSIRHAMSAVSERLTRFITNISYRLNMHEEFFCFECGMNYSEGEMRHTIGGWFGV